MKTTKRIFACLLIVVMLASMLCVGAGAINIVAKNDGTIFTYYKVLELETNADASAILYKWVSPYSTATGVDTTTYPGYVVVTDAVEFANAVINNPTGLTPKTVTAGTAGYDEPFENGYYVMKSSSSTQPFAFTVFNGEILTPATGSNDDSNIISTQITEKATLPEITKTVNGAETDVVGSYDDIEYTVTVKAEAHGKNYTVVDKLPEYIKYSGSVAVEVGGTALAPGNYTATYDAGTHTLKVTFTNAYLTTITSGTEIAITYTANLANDADIVDTTHTNTATLYYGDDNNTDGFGDFTKADSASVNTYKLTVTKYIADTTNPLANAKFKLFNGSQYAVVDTTTNVITNWDATGTELITPADGIITVIGLDNGSYTLIETDAPDGYIVAANESITIADANATATVYNTPGKPLPETGGIGTTVFYAAGGILVLGALVVLLMKKRTVTE